MSPVQIIFQELYKFSSDILTLNPPLIDDSRLLDFEKRNKVQLPSDFVEFLKTHDGIDLMGVMIYGFSGDENIENIYNFEHNQIEDPQYNYLIPFSPDGGGNYYCFDARKKTKRSMQVVFWVSNYEYKEDDQPEIVSESFVDWVKEVVIEWTLESYDYNGNER